MREICIAVAAFLILALTAGSSVVYALADWRTVTTITGNADQTTGYFNVPRNRWRIVWNITLSTPNSGSGAFFAFVYPKGESATYVSSICGNSTNTNGATIISEGSKEYYVRVSATDLQTYVLKIEYDAYSIPEYSTTAVVLAMALVSISVIVIRNKLRNSKSPSNSNHRPV